MNDLIFEGTMENVRKHRDDKRVIWCQDQTIILQIFSQNFLWL